MANPQAALTSCEQLEALGDWVTSLTVDAPALIPHISGFPSLYIQSFGK